MENTAVKSNSPKLFLYSLTLSDEQLQVLANLVNKDAREIKFAIIENAADVEQGSESWLRGFREVLEAKGFQLQRTDLREWLTDSKGLEEVLSEKDVIWLGGGNTFYLRWILKETGADKIIKELVIRKGKVYAGWSAGAIIAGPNLHHIDAMENLDVVPEVNWDGLNLTDNVVVPHMDNKDFSEVANTVVERLKQTGVKVIPLCDNQGLVVEGDKSVVI